VRPGAGLARPPDTPHDGPSAGNLPTDEVFTRVYGQLAETMRTDVTFRLCEALADIEPE
jgi:hypothetical protein